MSWNGIIIIDEADVFLEERSTLDFKHNQLVSGKHFYVLFGPRSNAPSAVFLRVLECYEGIMFLTTNRIGSFDSAFTSRIHLAIKYPKLSYQTRKDLWKAFILRASPMAKLDTASLDELAKEELNGRQIKNIVRTANSLAIGSNESIKLSHFKMGIRSIRNFERDFEEGVAKREAEEASDLPFSNSNKWSRVS